MSKTLDLGAVTAYALAVKNGFTGTEAEWLASLKGADGVSPTAENISSALGYTPAKQTDVDTLSQNLTGATGTFTAANSAITVNTGIDWHKITLIQANYSGAVGRIVILTPTFAWAQADSRQFYDESIVPTKDGRNATIPASVFSNWIGMAGTIRWLAE